MYTLVVVDMQPYFRAATGKLVLENCAQEITSAMAKQAAIIFLEFEGCGVTDKSLTKLTKYYSRTFTASKKTDDGSAEVDQIIYDHKLPSKKIRVCGVNTDCCVRSTVNGLTSRLSGASIKVIGSACASDWYHENGIDAMKYMPNVKVI